MQLPVGTQFRTVRKSSELRGPSRGSERCLPDYVWPVPPHRAGRQLCSPQARDPAPARRTGLHPQAHPRPGTHLVRLAEATSGPGTPLPRPPPRTPTPISGRCRIKRQLSWPLVPMLPIAANSDCRAGSVKSRRSAVPTPQALLTGSGRLGQYRQREHGHPSAAEPRWLLYVNGGPGFCAFRASRPALVPP